VLNRAQYYSMLRDVANFVKSNPRKFGETIRGYVAWQTDREMPGVPHEDETWIERFNELAVIAGRTTGYTPVWEVVDK
jgi:hypothetical protein